MRGPSRAAMPTVRRGLWIHADGRHRREGPPSSRPSPPKRGEGAEISLMSLVCDRCRRVNPDEAYYCYFDGASLAGRATSGPINLGTQPFPSPYVFPSGISARNFDQLAMACRKSWKEAIEMLREGYLASFFGSIGRVDLARAAQESAKFPEIHRGLDELLGKLPTQVLEAPKLHVEPTDMNLGQMAVGGERTIELQLANHGMRLIFGSVTSEVPWLTIGKGTGRPSRILEFIDDLRVPVQVRGQNLRARTKPQEGRIVLDTNAGKVTVLIRVEVPPVPFAGGVLAGSLSPRQLAEKAKANPAEAAPHFESGAVSRWFVANGLQYPVQGPTAPGMAGVQQFFEALGLAKPPKIDFAPSPIHFSGDPGQTFETTLEVSTPDKKLVYAYLSSEEPWIEGTPKPAGRTCAIAVKVTLPPRPGETLTPKVAVHANGNRRYPGAHHAGGARHQDVGVGVRADRRIGVRGVDVRGRHERRPGRGRRDVALAGTGRTSRVPAGRRADDADADLRGGGGRLHRDRRSVGRGPPQTALAHLAAFDPGAVARALAGRLRGARLPVRERHRSDRCHRSPHPLVRLLGQARQGQQEHADVRPAGPHAIRNRCKKLTYSTTGHTNSALFKIDHKLRAIGDFASGKFDGPVVERRSEGEAGELELHRGRNRGAAGRPPDGRRSGRGGSGPVQATLRHVPDPLQDHESGQEAARRRLPIPARHVHRRQRRHAVHDPRVSRTCPGSRSNTRTTRSPISSRPWRRSTSSIPAPSRT